MPESLVEAARRAIEARRQARPLMGPQQRREWYRIEAKAGESTAEVWIYDYIDPWGVNALDFARELGEIKASNVTVHINSPGGDAFDGIAIHNALRDHPAKITTKVDALAASAASLIAMAGDEVVMNRGSQMMIHDASGLCIGNAADMNEFAAVLSKLSDGYASIYAAKTGTPLGDVRAAMRAETWYSADEAVAAGLADRTADEEPDAEAQKAAARFDLTVFAHAGREHAPDPLARPRASTDVPAAPAAGSTEEEEAGMPNLDPAKLREALGLGSDASEEDVRAALSSAELPAPPEAPPAPVGGDVPQPVPVASLPQDGEVVVMDPAVLAELQRQAKLGVDAHAELQRQRRDEVIAQAIQQGKFPPERRDYWVAYWDADPQGAETQIKALQPGLVPVGKAPGYAGAGDFSDVEAAMTYERLYGEPEGVRRA